MFKDHDGLVEQGFLNGFGKISGRAQAAVRPVSLEHFNSILERGIPDVDNVLPRIDAPDPNVLESHFREAGIPLIFDQEWERTNTVSSRLVRDRVFRKIVLYAYDSRCAFTRLKLVNGGGCAEVDPAHIKAVEANGPDIVGNCIALSGTIHWMFDRGLVGLSDDLDILVSRQINDPERVWNLVNPSRKADLPHHSTLRPYPRFLEWHRQNYLKS